MYKLIGKVFDIHYSIDYGTKYILSSFDDKFMDEYNKSSTDSSISLYIFFSPFFSLIQDLNQVFLP